MSYVDPNSGAAPQPGGIAQTVVMTEGDEAQNPPSSVQDQEVLRQQSVGEEQEKAKQGEEEASAPAEADKPELGNDAEIAGGGTESQKKKSGGK